MKIRALIGVWLVALMGLAMCGASLPDIGLSSNRGKMAVGLKTSLGNGGGAGVDTTRIVSRDKLFPNKGARTAGYMTARDTVGAIINQGTAGQAVKWGHCYKGSASTVYYDGSAPYQTYILRSANILLEDNEVFQSSNYVGFVWVSANGLQAGDKVESAALIINTAAYEDFVIPAGEYFTARMDTVSADYVMTSTSVSVYAADTDTARMDISYNEVDATGNVAWSPDLNSRDDRHDFGPRADNVIGAGTYAGGTSLLLNVTSAVQQALDNAVYNPAIITRGFIFHLYASNGVTDEPRFSAGDYEPYVAVGKGCPTFRACTTSRRGARQWNSVKPVPVVFTFDDNYDAHVAYADAMWDAGYKFTTMNYTTGFNNNASYDSLLTGRLAQTEIVHHSSTHPYIGALTGATLNAQLELAAWYSGTYWTDPPDTSAIADYAWPVGGGGGQTYGFPAISAMVGYGYRSSRAPGTKLSATSPIGDVAYLSWEEPSNMYAVGSLFVSSIFQNGGVPADSAYVHDKLYDYIDICYTAGKSALVLYSHRDSDGMTGSNLRDAIEIIEKSNAATVMSYGDMISRRLAGATFLDPGEITAANGYSAEQELTAARTDSAMTANSDPHYLQVWISGK